MNGNFRQFFVILSEKLVGFFMISCKIAKTMRIGNEWNFIICKYSETWFCEMLRITFGHEFSVYSLTLPSNSQFHCQRQFRILQFFQQHLKLFSNVTSVFKSWFDEIHFMRKKLQMLCWILQSTWSPLAVLKRVIKKSSYESDENCDFTKIVLDLFFSRASFFLILFLCWKFL